MGKAGRQARSRLLSAASRKKFRQAAHFLGRCGSRATTGKHDAGKNDGVCDVLGPAVAFSEGAEAQNFETLRRELGGEAANRADGIEGVNETNNQAYGQAGRNGVGNVRWERKGWPLHGR